MAKLIICIGPPGCGKNTWVQSEIQKSKHNAVVVCRDDLRQMICGGNIHNYKFNNKNEDLVSSIQDYSIIKSLQNGINVYVADTNLADKTINHLTQLAKDAKAVVEKHNFIDEFMRNRPANEPIELQVERFRRRCKDWNLKRDKSVPEDVIDNFFEKYIVPNYSSVKPYVPNTSKPKAILVDLDGTLFHMIDRNPYDFDKVHTDVIDPVVKETLSIYKQAGYQIILASGRDDSCVDLTMQALKDNNINYDKLYMRKTGDQRADWIIKEELFFDKIAPHFSVMLALDDRNQVVNRYRAMGIKVFQVQPGNF